MQIKLLENLIEELAGVNSKPIVEILFNKRDVNEFLVAKKMNLTINQVRNILYKLSAEGLVSFIRKKDKRKGWYIYYWTLDTEKCLIRLEQCLIKKGGLLKNELRNRESKRFYICKACNIEVGEEAALEHGFICNECAEVYELANNNASIKDMKAKITRTERELKIINNELEIIKEKRKKKKTRDEKKTIKKKSVVRKKIMKVGKIVKQAVGKGGMKRKIFSRIKKKMKKIKNKLKRK